MPAPVGVITTIGMSKPPPDAQRWLPAIFSMSMTLKA